MDMNSLVKRLKKRDETALEEIITQYTPYVSTIIYNVSRGNLSVSDMEEATADVFITLWKNADNVRPDTLKGYIAAIAKSRARDKVRTVLRVGESVELDEALTSDDVPLADSAERKEFSETLRKAVDELGEPDSEIVVRYYYYYQTTAKIAQILDMKNETVKTKLKRSREKLKKILTAAGIEG